jgi:hypothetical protein
MAEAYDQVLCLMIGGSVVGAPSNKLLQSGPPTAAAERRR